MSLSVHIRKKLGNFHLAVDLEHSDGITGILGASGCGKSLTLKAVAGIMRPDEGRIVLNGRVLFDSEEGICIKPQEREVGYLFQNYALFPTMTVEKNIAAGLKGRKREKEARVQEMIRKFRLQGLERHLPGQLSGGQQQRTALARIMACEPGMILLDEPFSALDMYMKDQLQRELVEMLEDYPGTVILVSHNRDEVYRFSKELLVIDQGKIVAAGDTKALFRDPVSREAARLTGCKNFSKACRVDSHTVEAADWGVTLKVKREIPEYTEWIGFRAHDFIPVWVQDNPGTAARRYEGQMLPFNLDSSAELPFEKNYYIKTKADSTVCWFVQRDQEESLEKKGMPDYLAFNEEKLLFLK